MCLLGSKARIKVNNSLSDPFEILTALRQGVALLPLLFNVALEYVVRGLEDINEGVKVGKLVKLFAYTDDLDGRDRSGLES